MFVNVDSFKHNSHVHDRNICKRLFLMGVPRLFTMKINVILKIDYVKPSSLDLQVHPNVQHDLTSDDLSWFPGFFINHVGTHLWYQMLHVRS